MCCRGEPKCNGNVGHGIRRGDDGDRAGCAWCRWRVARPASAGVSEHSQWALSEQQLESETVEGAVDTGVHGSGEDDAVERRLVASSLASSA